MGEFREEIEISQLTRAEKYLPTRTLRETEIDLLLVKLAEYIITGIILFTVYLIAQLTNKHVIKP